MAAKRSNAPCSSPRLAALPDRALSPAARVGPGKASATATHASRRTDVDAASGLPGLGRGLALQSAQQAHRSHQQEPHGQRHP